MTKTIKINDFLDFKAFSQMKSSPNREKFAFVCSTQSEKENTTDRVIYVSNGFEFVQMTALNKESNFVWEDDQNLLFAAKRLKHEEDQTDQTFIYRLPLSGGEARCAYRIPLPLNNFWVLDENRLLILADYDVNHPNYYTYSKSKREKLAKVKKEEDYAIELNQIPYWFNGTQYINNQRSRLFIFDKENKELSPLTAAGFDVGQVVLSYDKKVIYYTGSTYKTKAPIKDKLYQLNVETLESHPIVSTNKYSISAIAPIKDTLYLFMDDNKKLGLNQNPNLYKVIEPNNFELLKEDIDLGNSIGSDVRLGANSPLLLLDDSFIYNITVDGHSELVEFDQHQFTTIFNQEGSVDGFTKVNDQLIIMGLFNQQLQDFYLSDTTRLTHFNDALDEKNVIKPEKITFESNGDEISGWVLYPEGQHEIGSLKAILDIHGGPKTAYGEVYYHEMQVWANMGYVVMYCNPHGSSGKGDPFSDIRGKYGTIDYQDIMTFVDKVLEKYPTINPERVAVTGGSYGGFMTNWIIGHTNRFVCAVTQRSISNWLSFYGVSDIGYYFAPDQNDAEIYAPVGQEKLWWHSPLRYAANFSTPTLVVHSSDDYRCPIDQGYQLFTALVDRRVDAKMLILKGENHDLSRSGKPKARLKRLTEITNWFKKYLEQ